MIRKTIYAIICTLLMACAFGTASETAPRKSKAKTTQTSKKKSKKTSSSKKKKKKSTSSKKKTSKKKTSKKKRSGKSRKSRAKRNNTIQHKQYTPPEEKILSDSLTLLINDAVTAAVPDNVNPGGLRVNSVMPDRQSRIARLNLNENFTYLPVTRDLIMNLRKSAVDALPDSLSDYTVTLNVRDKSLSYYITEVDKLPEQYRKNIPFVVEENPDVHPVNGMEGDIVALWPSHGRYYRPSAGGWMWQRPLLFQVCEDTYTMGYVLPYIAPMLENAGAYVMLPRERDINRNEVIVDNDINPDGAVYSQTTYREQTGSRAWATGEGEGFIYDLPDFRDTENPFENGTYRQTTTVSSGKPSLAAWYADIPEDGEYAVYVSYKSLPNSTEDALYTVNYSGGSKQYRVNQTMGGGTWIYLGTFPLEAGYSDTEPVVTLSNLSQKGAGKILTADAVKIGGGMGNIARSPHRSDVFVDPSTPLDSTETPEDTSEEEDEEDEETQGEQNENANDESDGEPQQADPLQASSCRPAPTFKISGMPRYLEGARYWLQWAGMPDYVYSPYEGTDDYKDDYTSRGHWVNYLAGGSRVLPGRDGLKIPVDVTMALHSDAGKKIDDSIVGTLGIYYTNGGDSYVDGTPRINSRMLTDMLMRQITTDIRQTYEPDWTRRSMWDKSYVEARVPEVPTSLIELMSHQNFGDMRYGLDPSFKFLVGRAVYKAIARFVAERKSREVVIQPLPVKDFSIERQKKGHYKLSWRPTDDPLEQTAKAEKYIIYERSEGELGFHRIGETGATHFTLKCNDNDIHSFKVIAANKGGMSFPSEVLSFREAPDGKDPVLIINGFTRISAPSSFSADGMAGFNAETDFGVPYIHDISFTGYQTEYNRSAGERFGRSSDEYASTVIAGNTFDYPAVHGASIAASGRGFISTSLGAVENGEVRLSDYKTVDLILGKQKATVTGAGYMGCRYIAFPEKLQKELTHFIDKGGRLFVSGEYVASDPYDFRAPAGSAEFAGKGLGIAPGGSERNYLGRIDLAGSLSSGRGSAIHYSTTLNEDHYIVENPDILTVSDGRKAEILMTYPDSGATAGMLTRHGKGGAVVSAIPFESIQNASERDFLMKRVLDTLDF